MHIFRRVISLNGLISLNRFKMLSFKMLSFKMLKKIEYCRAKVSFIYDDEEIMLHVPFHAHAQEKLNYSKHVRIWIRVDILIIVRYASLYRYFCRAQYISDVLDQRAIPRSHWLDYTSIYRVVFRGKCRRKMQKKTKTTNRS